MGDYRVGGGRSVGFYLKLELRSVVIACNQRSASCLSSPEESAGRTKTVAGSIGGVEVVDGQKFHGLDFLDEELRDAVAFLDEVFAVGVIEQEDFDFAAVLGIDHPGAAIDAMFDGHATARPDEADMALRQSEADAGRYQHFAAGRDDGIDGGTQVRSRVTRGRHRRV